MRQSKFYPVMKPAAQTRHIGDHLSEITSLIEIATLAVMGRPVVVAG